MKALNLIATAIAKFLIITGFFFIARYVNTSLSENLTLAPLAQSGLQRLSHIILALVTIAIAFMNLNKPVSEYTPKWGFVFMTLPRWVVLSMVMVTIAAAILTIADMAFAGAMLGCITFWAYVKDLHRKGGKQN